MILEVFLDGHANKKWILKNISAKATAKWPISMKKQKKIIIDIEVLPICLISVGSKHLAYFCLGINIIPPLPLEFAVVDSWCCVDTEMETNTGGERIFNLNIYKILGHANWSNSMNTMHI